MWVRLLARFHSLPLAQRTPSPRLLDKWSGIRSRRSSWDCVSVIHLTACSFPGASSTQFVTYFTNPSSTSSTTVSHMNTSDLCDHMWASVGHRGRLWPPTGSMSPGFGNICLIAIVEHIWYSDKLLFSVRWLLVCSLWLLHSCFSNLICFFIYIDKVGILFSDAILCFNVFKFKWLHCMFQ